VFLDDIPELFVLFFLGQLTLPKFKYDVKNHKVTLQNLFSRLDCMPCPITIFSILDLSCDYNLRDFELLRVGQVDINNYVTVPDYYDPGEQQLAYPLLNGDL
jgi:hypothetical protein